VKVLAVRDPVPVHGAREQRVAAIAGMQRDGVSRRQVVASGLSRGAGRSPAPRNAYLPS
jgi:hypothetical protein